MNSSDDADDPHARCKRVLAAVEEHAVSYRMLFFDQRDKNDVLYEELAASRRIRERQRQIIAKLEAQLGIDQDL